MEWDIVAKRKERKTLMDKGKAFSPPKPRMDKVPPFPEFILRSNKKRE